MTAATTTADTAARATRELRRLEGLVASTRVALARLESDVAAAEARLAGNASAQLLAANEQLLLAALLAQDEAATTALALEAVTQASQLDVLTGLPNRALLLARLSQALALARRHGGSVALLFMDLDRFKTINDTLGHACGDGVLRLVAERLSQCVRGADTVSRHGGDEFVVVLSEIAQAGDAARVARKMIAALGAPCRVEGHVLRLSASIGIALYPDDGDDAAALIDGADAAMYRAKRQGPGSFVFGAGAATGAARQA